MLLLMLIISKTVVLVVMVEVKGITFYWNPIATLFGLSDTKPMFTV